MGGKWIEAGGEGGAAPEATPHYGASWFDEGSLPSTSDVQETTNPVLAASTETGSGEVTSTDSWVERTTDDGHAYYYNTLSGESSWTLPTPTSMGGGGAAEYDPESESDDSSSDDETQRGRGSIVIGGHEWSTTKTKRRSSIHAPSTAVTTTPQTGRRSSFSAVL